MSLMFPSPTDYRTHGEIMTKCGYLPESQASYDNQGEGHVTSVYFVCCMIDAKPQDDAIVNCGLL